MNLQSIRNRIAKLEEMTASASGRFHLIRVPGVVPVDATQEQRDAASAEALQAYETEHGTIPETDTVFLLQIVNAPGDKSAAPPAGIEETTETPARATESAQGERTEDKAPDMPSQPAAAVPDPIERERFERERERDRNARLNEWSSF